MNKRTQHQQIINYLLSGAVLTPMIAFDRLKITKISTRIGELRRMGADIMDTWFDSTEKKKVCKVYRLLSLENYRGN